ncbi:hypothetical protein BCR41DRAFT_365453 [Lobosporangium transversale]|uniref:Uncharacterized protein n=1 Tax=Lobosporangium transversale TaxID=64571 RepID=A0A1Y2G907_9FUNG|nr:hypothetical protein BCR41DRAFT_365453 [Lobosporangium transversale]ORY93700.1 hypothetical protein BCR41DRAFT_365453 [Lobosporangium transversale]|eukprot:XP_021875195.1 hypothetical protein BCR41DRAFT_365453 [Lobosporangium transversale]
MTTIKKWAQGHYAKKRTTAAAAVGTTVVTKECTESKNTETLSTTPEIMSDENLKKREAKVTVPSVAGNDFRPGSMLLDVTSAIATTTTATTTIPSSTANTVDTVVTTNAMTASTSDELQAMEAHPIVNKVANHLLKFELLEEVWLGYGIWKV